MKWNKITLRQEDGELVEWYKRNGNKEMIKEK